MKTYFNKIKSFVIAHKIISVFVLVVVIGLGYWGYKKFTSTSGEIRYVTAKVEKGTIVASVSGTGQVSTLSQVDIKPKVSGDIVYVGAKNGDKVSAGAILVELDAKDAQKAVRDAEVSLDSANLALEKLKIQNSDKNISDSLTKAYGDGFNTVSDTFYDLNSILTGLNNILLEKNLSDNAARAAGNIALDSRNKANTTYYAALSALNQNNKDYQKLSNTSPGIDTENIIKETYDTTKLLADAIKSYSDFVDYMAKDSGNVANFTSTQTTLSTYTTAVNGHLSLLLTAKTNINNNKDSSENGSLDIQSAQLSLQQKQNALQDAKDNLSDYVVRAPLAGTITNLNLKKSDSVTQSTVVGTLIAPQQLAVISLNEVDVAKIKIGQKTTLTFDAVPDLTISGVVGEIDSIGTVSQGVVTYDVKINFDTQDDRVKTAMSVSGAIITDIKQDVLMVPNSAVKSLPALREQAGQGGTGYVEMFDSPLIPPTDGLLGSVSKIVPNKIPVEVGLSNDSQSEIISGIKEGDEIVTRTIQPKTATTSSAPSLFGSPAQNRGGGAGGGARIPARGN